MCVAGGRSPSSDVDYGERLYNDDQKEDKGGV